MATILVVDDDRTVVSLCQSILQLGGYQVLTAHGGEEALTVMGEHGDSIDLALIDIIMPGMNGIQLADRIRKANPELPTILMTGYSLREVQAVIGSHQPYRIIWKPFKTESLLRMIENALEGGGPLTSLPRAS